MNKQEFFAAVKAYKEGKPLRPKVSRDYTIDDWADQYYDQAVALKAKALLAHSCDRSFDENIYNQQLGILTHMLDGMDESAEILADIESDAKEVLEHGAKWKDHKYIRIENGRYIYPEDLKAREYREASKKAARDSADAGVERGAWKENVKDYWGKVLDNPEATDEAKKRAQEKVDYADEKIKEKESIMRKGDSDTNVYRMKAERQKEIADRKRFDDSIKDIAKLNEQRKANNAKAQAVQTARSQSDESAAKAQREGEAMQAWKNQQEAKRKEYEADIKKMASESISAWASGEDDNNGGKYAAKVNEIGDKYVWDKSITADKMISDYANAVYEEYLKKKDSLSPEVRTRIENALSNIEDKYKPKKVTHSFDLSTKEGYYAAIEEYKRKKA